jgi:methylase of polypeptide subunit release factors
VKAGKFANAAEEQALLGLLAWLKARGYRFVTITPASHARVISRAGRQRADDLAGAFGWSLPFARELLPQERFAALESAGLLAPADGGLYRSKVRVSSLGNDLFVHSAFPTDDEDAVFFGPDSYRFAAMIERELERRDRRIASIVDIGTGGGVGAIVAGGFAPARASPAPTSIRGPWPMPRSPPRRRVSTLSWLRPTRSARSGGNGTSCSPIRRT